MAALRGKTKIMGVVLKYKPDLKRRFYEGETPLHAATYSLCHRAVSLLLDNGAQIDAQTDADGGGETPLMTAARRGAYAVVHLLLRRGADVARSNVHGIKAERLARGLGRRNNAALLADVRVAGGTWADYLRVPRTRVLALRILCERGRATPPTGHDGTALHRLIARARDASSWAEAQSLLRAAAPAPPGLLARLFPHRDAAASDERPPRRARGPRELPKEVFWRVLEYWRCDRDDLPPE